MDSSQMNHYMSQLWNDERLFIVALDKDGRVTYANPKTQELFCNPAGGLMGEEWIETAVVVGGGKGVGGFLPS